jgi:hypothetical protein
MIAEDCSRVVDVECADMRDADLSGNIIGKRTM